MWKTLHKNKQDNHNKLIQTHTSTHRRSMCVFGPNNKAQSAAAPPIRLKWTRYNEKGISKRFCIRCAIYGRSIFFYLFYIFTAVCCCLFLFSRINFSAQTRVHMHYSFLKLHGKLCRLIQAASLKHTHTLTQQTITLAQQIFCTAEISKRWKKKNSAHTRFFTNHFHFNESCSHTTIYSRCPPFSISLFLAPRYTEAHLVIMLLHLDYVYVNSRRINEPFNGHITFGECLFTVWHYWTKGRKINRNYSFDSNVIYRKRTENGNEMKFIQENHSKLGAKK